MALCRALKIDFCYGLEGFIGEEDVKFYYSLPDEWSECLIKQNVSLDDYDYAIVMPSTSLVSYVDSDVYAKDELVGWPLLFGCCENKWHRVVIEGKTVALGMAYHA